MLTLERSTAALVVALSLAAAGCGDSALSPDAVACTRGTIAPGDSVSGAITGASCTVFSDAEYTVTKAESWTLQAKRNTAYIVRVLHIPDGNGDDHWQGELLAYARTPQGEQTFATGWFGSFGAVNLNGGQNEEMFLASDADRPIAIRIESESPTDTGAYSLMVQSCPLRSLAPGQTITGLDMSTACTALGIGGASGMKVAFFSFPVDTTREFTAIATRTAGTSGLSGYLTGPDLDVGCWTDDCYYDNETGDPTVTLNAFPSLAGRETLTIASDAAATATINVAAGPTLDFAPRPRATATVRPRATAMARPHSLHRSTEAR